MRAALVALTGSAEPDDGALAALADRDPELRAAASALRALAAAPPAHGRGVRARALLAWSEHGAVWDAWETLAARRVYLRQTRRPGGAFLPDPDEALRWMRVAPDLEVSEPWVETLADALPDADVDDPVWLARLLRDLLGALRAAHAAGRAHGAVDVDTVVWTGSRWRLAWWGTSQGRHTLLDDVAAIGRLVTTLQVPDALGTDGLDTWPLAVDDVPALVIRGMADRLSDAWQGVLARTRSRVRADRVRALTDAAERLARLPPPRGAGCLYVGTDGAGWVLRSDGRRVDLGRMVGDGPVELGPVWDGDTLDSRAARAALRAWSQRARGDAAHREQLDRLLPARLGVTGDAPTGALVRWLAMMVQLRTDRLLLAREQP